MSSHLSNMHIIEQVQTKSLPLDNPLYQNYPAMKLGRKKEVEFYSDYFVKFALPLLSNDRGKTDWVITAPSYYQLPAAANLMALDVQRKLADKGFPVELTEMRLKQNPAVIRKQQEKHSHAEYSQTSMDERIKVRQKLNDLLDDSIAEGFINKSVIIINDINVTGAQQKFMEGNLRDWQAKNWHWFYIFSVEPELAAKHPEIEYQLNHSQINDLASFAKVLNDTEVSHTARGIGRLFDQKIEDFRTLVTMLSEVRRNEICLMAKSEDRYNGESFIDKMALLEGDVCQS